MTGVYFTNFSGTIFGFLSIKPTIKKAPQTNTECGFKKQENQTDQANQTRDGTI